MLAAEVEACAGGLRAAGLGPGDTIALTGTASAEWLIALHAIGWMGGIAAPLPHGVPLAEHLQTTDAAAVLAAEAQGVPHPRVLSLGLRADPMPAAHPMAPSTPSLQLLTSGTTGSPRAVRLSWAQLDAAAQASQARLGHSASDAWLGCLPLHHIGGLSVFLRSLRSQTVGVLHSGFDAAHVGAALDSGEITQVSLVPSMLQAVLDARPARGFHPSLRVLLLGGAPMPAALLERCRDLRLPVALSWGMTETAAQIATREPGDLRAAADVGHPLPGLQVHTEDGYLVVQGPTVPGGRWKTTDRGCVDSSGRVIVFGRGSDLILSGGENIDPSQVEQALMTHPAVKEAAVIGRPDTRWGARPVAFLVASGTERPSQSALRAHLAQTLTDFMAPDAITWVDTLPRGPMGKLERSVLVEKIQAGQAIQEG
jgi:O-succinylbenzoic acid--CoA ligase